MNDRVGKGVTKSGEWKKAPCAMCVLSCGLEMEVENDRIINVRPDPDSPRSHGYCCRKERTAKHHLENLGRSDYPLKVVVPHHYRSVSQGKQYGETVNKLVGCLRRSNWTAI